MFSYRRYGERGEKKVCFPFLFYFFTWLHAAELVHSRWKLSTRWAQTPLATIRPSISTYRPTHGRPVSCLARPIDADDGLQDIRWIRGLGGKRLPPASYALLLNLKVCFWPSDRFELNIWLSFFPRPISAHLARNIFFRLFVVESLELFVSRLVLILRST